MVLVLAVGTSRAACADAAAAACYTARCYYCILLSALLVGTALYYLLYVRECGLLLLAIHIPERLATACYLLWSFLTKYKTCQET